MRDIQVILQTRPNDEWTMRSSLDGRRLVSCTEIRLSEIIAALSVALDITQGHPQGHSMRSCLIGMRLARKLRLSNEDLSALFYGLLLKDLGCSSNAAKISYLFGNDDRSVKRSLRLIDWTNPIDCIKYSWSCCLPDGSRWERFGCLMKLFKAGPKAGHKIAEIRCERGAAIASMLQLSDATVQAIRDLDEHWNGGGNPSGKRREEISLLGRICGLAQCVEVFFSQYGLDAAYGVARKRSGTWFDPKLVAALETFRGDGGFWGKLASADLMTMIHQWEPGDELLIADEEGVDRIAEAFAQVVDAKSPWTYLHSSRVAEIAVGVATELGLGRDMLRDIRRVALLHDIGKLGVSNRILDKPEKPTDEEFAQIRKHPRYSYQILRQVDAFRDLARVAGGHHERLDGRGYHRGLAGDQICNVTRIVTIADVCEALTAKRPYRDALEWEAAREILRKDVNRGVDATCFDALTCWLDRQAMPSRVERQLEAVDNMFADLQF